MTKATDMIAAERERQITEEGYTAEHDAGEAQQLVQAAVDYGHETIMLLSGHPLAGKTFPMSWPWAERYWKPTGDPVRDLVKAGALIAAAIDSLYESHVPEEGSGA